MRLDTHVILVSHQPTPNLTPALDPEIKPANVVMLVSPDMRQRADWLADVLRPRGIRVERYELPDAHDVEDLRARLLDMAAERAGEAIALNVTGGTKLMALAAYEAFLLADKPIFYVHPDRDRLIWLHPRGLLERDLADRVRLDPFLQAHGARLAERPAGYGMPANLRSLAGVLVRDVERHANALASLNWAAMKAEAAGSLVSPELDGLVVRDGFREFLAGFEAEGVLTVRSGRLHFASPEARCFANGGWLEQHAYALVQDLKSSHPGIQDLGRGLEVERGAAGREIRNELDVAFLANNRLHVIECKTRLFSDDTGRGGAGAEALYKLDALANLLGGLQARAMLVSYQPLKPAVLDRARDCRIATCAHIELPNLGEHLRRWLA